MPEHCHRDDSRCYLNKIRMMRISCLLEIIIFVWLAMEKGNTSFELIRRKKLGVYGRRMSMKGKVKEGVCWERKRVKMGKVYKFLWAIYWRSSVNIWDKFWNFYSHGLRWRRLFFWDCEIVFLKEFNGLACRGSLGFHFCESSYIKKNYWIMEIRWKGW